MDTIDLFRKKYLKKAFAFLAVMLMLATAFIGIIGVVEESDASGSHGTSSSPLSSLSLDGDDCVTDSNKDYYVYVGSSVSIVSISDDEEVDFAYNITGVTAGYGLTYNNGKVSGTISKAGNISVSYNGWNGINDYNGSITIHAIAKQTTNYTVTISAGTGGTVSKSSVSVPSGTSISTSGNTLTIGSNTITATANSGYSFSSWSNASGTVTANRTITANFTSNGYKVTFNATTNGGTCSTSSLTGSTITLPSASKSSTSSGSTSSSPWILTTTSYSFDGWYTSASGGTRVGGAGDSYSPPSAKTLYAHFSSSTSTSYGYKIIYDANGGSGVPNSQTGTSSGTSKNFTIPSSTPTRSGYTFLGWSTSSTATSASYIKSTQYSFGYGQTTLYAVWQQNGTMYYAKLAYDANGGSGAPSQQSVSGSYMSNPGSYGFTIPSTIPTRSGYTFLGWSTSSTATSASYSPGSTIYVDYATSSTSKVTLCAVWQKNDIVFTSSLTVNQAACVRGSTFSYTPTFNTTGVSISVSAKDSGNNTVNLFTVSNGKISCTPSQDGEYSVTVTATKSGWTSATQTFTFYVAEPLGFTSVPSGSIIVTEAS